MYEISDKYGAGNYWNPISLCWSCQVHGLYLEAFRNLRLMDEPDQGELDQFTEVITLLKRQPSKMKKLFCRLQ